MVDPSWLPDPTGRFEHRYWNGTQWTEDVSRSGVPTKDPLSEQPAAPTDAAIAATAVAPSDAAPAGDKTGFGASVSKSWHAFRRWPKWAQITTAAVLVIIVVAAIVSGGGESNDKDAASSNKAATGTTAAEASLPTTAPVTSPTTVAPSTTRPPAPTTTSPPPGFSGTGTYVVGQNVQPGLYVSKDNTTCYWQRSTDASGSLNSIIENENARGQGLVQINPGEVFTTRNCGRWTIYVPPAQLLNTFGDGTWVVGTQIPNGRWQSSGATSCYWERMANHDGGIDSINANDNVDGPTVVDIIDGDAGFKSQRCGTWTRVG